MSTRTQLPLMCGFTTEVFNNQKRIISFKYFRKYRQVLLVLVFTTLCFSSWIIFVNTIEPEHVNNIQEISKNNKIILQWTLPDTIPFKYMGVGQKAFIEKNCSFQNCFVTSDRSLLKDLTDYDAIVFHGPELTRVKRYPLPPKRSAHQKYVFVSIESSDYYPFCDDRYNGFFNWTWTYKLTSDELYSYITVRDINGTIVGPSKDVDWLKTEDMKPITTEMRLRMTKKTKAAAWFVSNCHSRSNREKFVESLRKELIKLGHTIDVYGGCGRYKCPRDSKEECWKKIEKDYFFYLSLENSFDEDYVTEKILHALKNYAIPVVYGDANYTRFMPDGIYLNGRVMGPAILAKKMVELIKNKEEYYSYFKWHNHYSYHATEEAPDSDDYCRFCEMLNDEKLMRKTTVYENFKEWWTPSWRCPKKKYKKINNKI